MRQNWSRILNRLALSVLTCFLVWILLPAVGKTTSWSPFIIVLLSVASVVLSALAFYRVWRAPQGEQGIEYMAALLLIGFCLPGSYLGWVYGPVWTLGHDVGYILGMVVGGVLALALLNWEMRAIRTRRKRLLAQPQ